MSRRDKVYFWLARHLPRRVKMWVVAQAAAQASFDHPTTEMHALTPADLVETMMP